MGIYHFYEDNMGFQIRESSDNMKKKIEEFGFSLDGFKLYMCDRANRIDDSYDWEWMTTDSISITDSYILGEISAAKNTDIEFKNVDRGGGYLMKWKTEIEFEYGEFGFERTDINDGEIERVNIDSITISGIGWDYNYKLEVSGEILRDEGEGNGFDMYDYINEEIQNLYIKGSTDEDIQKSDNFSDDMKLEISRILDIVRDSAIQLGGQFEAMDDSRFEVDTAIYELEELYNDVQRLEIVSEYKEIEAIYDSAKMKGII